MEKQDKTHHSGADGQAPDKLSELFRHVDRREKPPAEETLAIKNVVHAEWTEHLQKQQSKRWRIGVALAASLFAAISLTLFLQQDSARPAVNSLAEAGKIVGVAQLITDVGNLNPAIHSQQALQAGDSISTGNHSGLSLRWQTGANLRLGENSILQLESADQVRLQQGSIFIDTGRGQPNLPAPAVLTAQGQVKHIGTTWITETGDFGTRVSVRDGIIHFSRLTSKGDDIAPAKTGEQLWVASSGEKTISTIDTWGEDWAWAENLAENFPREERNMDELFRWIGHETGRVVIYLSPEARQKATNTLLHGEFSLPPKQALSVATEASDFSVKLVEGEMLIDVDQ